MTRRAPRPGVWAQSNLYRAGVVGVTALSGFNAVRLATSQTDGGTLFQVASVTVLTVLGVLLLPTVFHRLRADERGLRVPRWAWSTLVPWDQVRQVEPVPPGRFLHVTLRVTLRDGRRLGVWLFPPAGRAEVEQAAKACTEWACARR